VRKAMRSSSLDCGTGTQKWSRGMAEGWYGYNFCGSSSRQEVMDGAMEGVGMNYSIVFGKEAAPFIAFIL